MNERRHCLTVRRDARWETRDERFTLYRDADGQWRAMSMSFTDHKAVRDAGLNDSGTLGFGLGLGLHETAEVIAHAVGGDPRVRWKRSSVYRVADDGNRIPYTVVRRTGGWQAVEHLPGCPPYQATIRRIGPLRRTRAEALDAIEDDLAGSGASEPPPSPPTIDVRISGATAAAVAAEVARDSAVISGSA